MIDYPFAAIDHVQLAMPAGAEERARQFYSGVLGMQEVPKPTELAKSGGVWFQSGNVQIHLGVELDFRPARKAHAALRCVSYDDFIHKLRRAGVKITPDDRIPGVRRCHIEDCFGNRIELMEGIGGGGGS
jgi:catechol 2,3-dioxygenase-like lactoylglutathione lyase family enzyme